MYSDYLNVSILVRFMCKFFDSFINELEFSPNCLNYAVGSAGFEPARRLVLATIQPLPLNCLSVSSPCFTLFMSKKNIAYAMLEIVY